MLEFFLISTLIVAIAAFFRVDMWKMLNFLLILWFLLLASWFILIVILVII